MILTDVRKIMNKLSLTISVVSLLLTFGCATNDKSKSMSESSYDNKPSTRKLYEPSSRFDLGSGVYIVPDDCAAIEVELIGGGSGSAGSGAGHGYGGFGGTTIFGSYKAPGGARSHGKQGGLPGKYLKVVIETPKPSYTFMVGVGGIGGSAGKKGSPGMSGENGVIIVTPKCH